MRPSESIRIWVKFVDIQREYIVRGECHLVRGQRTRCVEEIVRRIQLELGASGASEGCCATVVAASASEI